ncbi:DNA primase small subunit [Dermatophagoides farinae]|uniref:DNA primase n=1 Tax=Dermatophagoides farinae TaxID=6954 RepID=A0A922KZG8_DERFA|nr:primase, DNA, polypeptide 1 (49kDa) [Dermatophagoides farinae]
MSDQNKDLSYHIGAYYAHLFPYSLFYQWLSYANVEKDYFSRREFSFTLNGDIYLRFNSFESLAEMRKCILARMPTKIDIGAVYSSRPCESRKIKLMSFQPQSKELVFDIDMTDYDDIRTCCKGAEICQKCWMFMVIAARILEAYLREDLGFKNILWVYSGRRGIHCWVADERARRLGSDGRDAIACFINIFDGGQFKAKKVEIDGLKGCHPSLARSIHIIDKYFEELMINRQDFLATKEQIKMVADLCLDKPLREEILQTLLNPNETKCKTSLHRWKMICSLASKFYSSKGANHLLSNNRIRHRYFLEEIKFQFCYPRLDINVTRGLNHLLKVPFSIHPKTGRICVPIDFEKLDQFDPFAVPTLSTLIEEMDKISITQDTEKTTDDCTITTSIAYRTSLAPSLNLFRKFIQNIEHGLRPTKLSEQDDRSKIDFS